MSGSVNRVTLIGNLGQDPEIRSFQSGDRVANFSLATSESWKDKAGEKKQRTEWHKIVCTNQGLIKVIEAYVKKGSKIYIEGQLETRKWLDNQGVEKYTTEVVLRPYRGELTLLDSKSSQSESGKYDNGPDPQGSLGHDGGLEDEIPFMRHNDFIGA